MHFSIYKTIPLLVIVLAHGNAHKNKIVDLSEIPELQYLNKSVDPCENFYEFTCGNFKNVHQKPEEELIWDHFTILQKEIHALLKLILESERHSGEPIALQKAKAAYAACVNVHYANQLKLPQKSILLKEGGWPLVSNHAYSKDLSWNQIGDLIATYGIPLFFDLQVGPNLYNASENVIWFVKDKISNPATINGRLERNYERYLDEPNLTKRDTQPIPFETFVRKIAFRLRDEVGSYKSNDAIEDEVAELLDFMRVLMKGGTTDGAKFDTIPAVTSIAKLQAWTDKYFGSDLNLHWLTYLNHVFKYSGVTVTEDMKVLNTNTALIYGVLNFVRQSETRVLRNFVMMRLFTYMAPDSDAYMRNAFDSYYTDQKYDVYSRDEYCLRKIIGYPSNVDLSMALTYEYQRYHFNNNKLQSAAEMVEDLQEVFKDILTESDWIDETSKEKALQKAANMITLLGFPDYAADSKLLDQYYQNLRICEWDHFGNAQRLRAFRQAVQFSQMGVPRNRELWNLSPLEVNAFYNRPNNRILFPVSVLNPVFYTGSISALDYARIGAVIGHEITHGFDKGGMTYDEEGNMQTWWTNSTKEAFDKKLDCFKKQYGNYYIDEIGEYVNAENTINENIADNGGLREAYKAFQRLKSRHSTLITVDDFTTEQLFFIGFGTMWCMTETSYYLQQMHDTNVYSPGRYRVIGSVSNMKEFARAFSCPIGSKMNPENKCILW